jgi:hypothetical protein
MDGETRTDKITTEHKETQNLLKRTAPPLVEKIRTLLLRRTLRIFCVLISKMPLTLLASG